MNAIDNAKSTAADYLVDDDVRRMRHLIRQSHVLDGLLGGMAATPLIPIIIQPNARIRHDACPPIAVGI
ncbi:MAG: hypothetical protein FJX06_11685 [Alphaproteobacteria bacterium]|nr:hypothetical protein [Alphaproteobacteria bacterium]